MEQPTELPDDLFEQQFKDCTLDAATFNHKAHLRLAWIHIKKYGEAQAIKNIGEHLIAFTQSLGAEDKYNKTLTIAAIKAVHHFMNRSTDDTFDGFINRFPQLKTNFRELMAAHYSIDIFAVAIAKKQYMEPDLLPFD
jgi:hypothetical protein